MVDMKVIWSVIGIMVVEDWTSSSGETSDSEVYVQDTNDEEHCSTSGDIPRLQFRKDVSKARWNNELGMAEVVEKKGRMWTTTGLVRSRRTYCSVEETLFLAEIGALHLLHDDDTSLPLKDMYKKVAEGKSGCCWESFEAMPEINGIMGKESEDKNLIVELFSNMQINKFRTVFDIYSPNSKFRKSSPGSPSFVLCLTSCHPPSKPEIEDLERRYSDIPLKVCHVDHGRVNFFSFNRVELPALP
ncbi:uncharacterized protein LOC132313578 isoform X2 [Cornus florida]|uniref:uncharacterized protein LOC132313578 isoform X2 n=1 Tax=Cornus florida TaxID=4283 RepID=UPI00289928E8|nr:uncharacterized protein LOC132313578 isoform X2 [Cornus florida]